MASFAQISQTNLSLPPNSYIYKLVSTAPGQYPLSLDKLERLGVIASDDSLHFLDGSTLQITESIKKANKGVTCLERVNHQFGWNVATAGRDGVVNVWDRRQTKKCYEIQARTLHKQVLFYG